MWLFGGIMIEDEYLHRKRISVDGFGAIGRHRIFLEVVNSSVS